MKEAEQKRKQDRAETMSRTSKADELRLKSRSHLKEAAKTRGTPSKRKRLPKGMSTTQTANSLRKGTPWKRG